MYNNETTQMNDNDYKHINLDYLDVMSDGDDDMKKTMLEMLLVEIPEELQKMRASTAAANWTELSAISHKMKSTLAFVGNKAMTEANKELELIAKNEENTQKAPALVEVLETCFVDVVGELQLALNVL